MTIPGETYVPFVLALGLAVIFLALLVGATLLGIVGLALAATGLVIWGWRTEADLK